MKKSRLHGDLNSIMAYSKKKSDNSQKDDNVIDDSTSTDAQSIASTKISKDIKKGITLRQAQQTLGKINEKLTPYIVGFDFPQKYASKIASRRLSEWEIEEVDDSIENLSENTTFENNSMTNNERLIANSPITVHEHIEINSPTHSNPPTKVHRLNENRQIRDENKQKSKSKRKNSDHMMSIGKKKKMY